MEIENVDQLLDYVFTDEDFSDSPSVKEYKKLLRIMTVMTRFYVRGEEVKKSQHETLLAELQKITLVEQMIHSQLQSLSQFPSFHPKRKSYEEELKNELEDLLKHKMRFKEQAVHYGQLHTWGQGIVSTMHWLEKNLKNYANQELKTSFEDLEDIKISVEDFKKYKRGLDEVTYNLQESQDFFDASLDGRLHKYHQIEKCMIEAQLQAIRTYPENNERRRHVELELEKDLAYVCDNMQDNPNVRRHRERMQQMHKDFFAILKWYRRKIDQILAEEPHKIIGDVDQLRKDLAEISVSDKSWNSKFGKRDQPSQTTQQPDIASTTAGECPVKHVANPPPQTTTEEKPGYIHKLYEKDK